MWFYLVKDGGRYILATDEVDPPPVSVAHKSHIAKVMFLSACARPQYNYTMAMVQWSHWDLSSRRAGYVCSKQFYSQARE
jgi:hypothetical protein